MCQISQRKMQTLTAHSCTTLLFAQLVMITVGGAITPTDSHTLFFPIHIQVFESSGFRAFLSPTTFPLVGLQFFAFHSNVNAPIRLMQNGRHEGVVTSADFNGYWLFDVPTIRLHAGDVINYWAYVEVNGVGYKIDSRTFMVHADDILPSAARFAVSHYDEYPNWRQNQIFDNQIHHHKVNYYNFSGTCVPRNANIIQLGNFNETLVELACTTNHLQQLNEEISRLNLLFSGLRMEDRQRINYFLTEMMRIEDANAVDPR